MYRVSPFVPMFAKSLLGGVGIATLWVNLNPASYYDAVEYRLADLAPPDWLAIAPSILTPRSLVSEGLMALFMFYIGKELWEALVLERGALSGRARATMPLGAVLGGMIGAVVVWLGCAALFGAAEGAEGATIGTGWPLPLGSDVVLCYFFGSTVFPRNHPALHLLLLIAIAYDIIGLLVFGLAFPEASLRPVWLLVPLVVAGLVWAGVTRLGVGSGVGAGGPPSERDRRRVMVLWPYVIAGAACWLGTLWSGLPGALGLLVMIPVIPHAERSFGVFAEAEGLLHDPLNRLTQVVMRPLPWILFLFGLTRGGVDLSTVSATTGATLAALWIGKPIGLLCGALAAGALTGTILPRDVRIKDLILIAVLSGTGFTVPVLAIDSTLPGGLMAEAARAGLALSLLAGPLAMLLGRLWRR